MRKEPVIITCSMTGNMTMPSQTPYLPVTPEQIIDSAVGAAKAGAAVVHLHVRKPDGQPCGDLELWKQILKGIKAQTDAVLCTSTGGGPGMTIEERANVVVNLGPELASMNLGSMNFANFHAMAGIKEWKHDWEKEYMEKTHDYVFRNTFKDIEYMCQTMNDAGIKPELEVYDVGHLYNANYLARKGFLKFPIHMQFVMGVLGGIGNDIRDLINLLETAERLFGKENFTWSVIGIGYPAEFHLGAVSACLGGHLRVGMEDNIKVKKHELATSNAQLVTKMKTILEDLDFEVATSAYTRQALGLKGIEKVNY